MQANIMPGMNAELRGGEWWGYFWYSGKRILDHVGAEVLQHGRQTHSVFKWKMN